MRVIREFIKADRLSMVSGRQQLIKSSGGSWSGNANGIIKGEAIDGSTVYINMANIEFIENGYACTYADTARGDEFTEFLPDTRDNQVAYERHQEKHKR